MDETSYMAAVMMGAGGGLLTKERKGKESLMMRVPGVVKSQSKGEKKITSAEDVTEKVRQQGERALRCFRQGLEGFQVFPLLSCPLVLTPWPAGSS